MARGHCFFIAWIFSSLNFYYEKESFTDWLYIYARIDVFIQPICLRSKTISRRQKKQWEEISCSWAGCHLALPNNLIIWFGTMVFNRNRGIDRKTENVTDSWNRSHEKLVIVLYDCVSWMKPALTFENMAAICGNGARLRTDWPLCVWGLVSSPWSFQADSVKIPLSMEIL